MATKVETEIGRLSEAKLDLYRRMYDAGFNVVDEDRIDDLIRKIYFSGGGGSSSGDPSDADIADLPAKLGSIVRPVAVVKGAYCSNRLGTTGSYYGKLTTNYSETAQTSALNPSTWPYRLKYCNTFVYRIPANVLFCVSWMTGVQDDSTGGDGLVSRDFITTPDIEFPLTHFSRYDEDESTKRYRIAAVSDKGFVYHALEEEAYLYMSFFCTNGKTLAAAQAFDKIEPVVLLSAPASGSFHFNYYYNEEWKESSDGN